MKVSLVLERSHKPFFPSLGLSETRADSEDGFPDKVAIM